MDLVENLCPFFERDVCQVLSAARHSTIKISRRHCAKCEAIGIEAMMLSMAVEARLLGKDDGDKALSLLDEGWSVSPLPTGQRLAYREVEGKRRLIEPPKWTMLKNFLGATKDVGSKLVVDIKDKGLWNGLSRVKACDQQVAARMARCMGNDCGHLTKDDKGRYRCYSFPGGEEGCGCRLVHKVKFAASRCKLTFWDAIDNRYKVETTP